MRIKIDSNIRISEVPEDILRQIKLELTMENPDYKKKLMLGIPTYGETKLIKLWSEINIAGNKEYMLPRGYYSRLWEITGGEKVQCDDNRLLSNKVVYPSKPTLRDYQKPCINEAMNWQQGVAVMPCGSGKTESALAIVAELQQPTLWITHTMDLLNQSMERAHSRLGLKGFQIGIIQGQNCSIGTHMTFATVQTLAKRDLTEIKNRFGCVVIDEAHLVFKDAAKARMFESVISQLPAFYRFGLTASEFRSDGLINTMFHIIGPKIYEIEQDDKRLPTIIPRVEFIETSFMYEPEDGEMLNVAKMVKAMREDPLRDRIILQKLIPEKDPVCTLVLGDSLEHLDNLCERISDHLGSKYEYAFICGDTRKKEREKIMTNMRDGKINYLFATYQLAKLGLDIPRLNKLVLATPKRDKTSIQQAVGRIMRPFEGKEPPIVYDIYDSSIPQLRYWARDRVRVYQKLGCEIIGGPKVRKI